MESLATPATERTSTNYRWVICALLFYATTVNYADRQILALLKPMLDSQLHWTETTFGEINAAFQGAYGVSLFFFGWIIDRWGTKRGYAVSIAGWSTAAIGHALVGSVSGFFAARVALGLCEGGNFPAAIKATAEWFPKKERAFATSLFNSGANVGAIVAPAIVPPIAYYLNWHWAFIFAGIAGYIWLLFWFPLFSRPEVSRRVSATELAHIESDSEPEQSETSRVNWGDLLKYRQAWGFIVAKFLTDPVWWFFLIWLPDFFKHTRGMDIRGSGKLLVIIYSIVTVLSIFGGWLSGYLMSRGWSVTKARKASMILFALCVVPIAFAPFAGLWVAVLLIGLAGAAHQAWSATIFTTVSDIFPKKAVATLVGLGSTFGSIGGMLFPIITGMILDHFKHIGYPIVFSICSGAYLVAFVANHALSPSFAPVDFKMGGE